MAEILVNFPDCVGTAAKYRNRRKVNAFYRSSSQPGSKKKTNISYLMEKAGRNANLILNFSKNKLHIQYETITSLGTA